jgi:hypothetical protein
MAVVTTMPGSGWHYAAASGGIADTADVTLAAAPTNSQRNYLTALQITNKDVSVGTDVVIKDGSTVLWRIYIQPGTPASLSGLVPVSFTFPTAIRQPTAGVALTAACITTSSETYINAQGYVDQ